MTPFEKEFAIPRKNKRWSVKGVRGGVRTHPSGPLMEELQQPPMAPIENISSLMTVGKENFKWTPEKYKPPPSNPDDVSSWSMPVMKLRFLLCFLGALPLTWKKPHTPSTHPIKSTMLYSIAVFSAISVSVGIAGSDLVGMLADDTLSQGQSVLDLEMTIMLVAHLLTPILWFDSHCQSSGFDAWSSLTKDFYRVTGRKLVNRRLGMELAFILCVVLFPALSGLILIALIKEFDMKLSHAPAYIHGGMIQYGLSFIWIGTCLTLADVADEITVAFQEGNACVPGMGFVSQIALLSHHQEGYQFYADVFGHPVYSRYSNAPLYGDVLWICIPSTERNGATSDILVEYRRLWVMLRSISDLMGGMLSPLFLVTHTLVFTTLLLYEGLIFINRGENVPGIAHLCTSLVLVIQLFFVCRASHLTALHMKLPLESVLDTLPVANLSSTAEREVIMFYLVENAKPAVTTLNGFVIVNKSLFSSMLAAVSTYLIVLMQFHQSSEGFSSRNTTVSFI